MIFFKGRLFINQGGQREHLLLLNAMWFEIIEPYPIIACSSI
jgi:hypothetical protein